MTTEIQDLPRYMVIERFHDGAIDKVYQRFESKGRMLPEGLHYIDSWLSRDANICFQIMATDRYNLFEQWFLNWNDLTDFEIYPVNSKPN